MTLTAELVRFLRHTTYHDLPPVAVERGQMGIASTLANALAGTGFTSARIIRSLAQERSGMPIPPGAENTNHSRR